MKHFNEHEVRTVKQLRMRGYSTKVIARALDRSPDSIRTISHVLALPKVNMSQAVYDLHEGEGLTFEAIACILDLPSPKTARTAYNRVRRQYA